MRVTVCTKMGRKFLDLTSIDYSCTSICRYPVLPTSLSFFSFESYILKFNVTVEWINVQATVREFLFLSSREEDREGIYIFCSIVFFTFFKICWKKIEKQNIFESPF